MKAITHYKDRIGQKFERMTIIAYEPIKHRGRYVCQCECGIIKSVDCSQLINGEIKSCGCLSKELLVQRNKNNKYSAIHNKSKTRLYQIWLDMKQRCYNPKQNAYKWYGAKGVEICKEWKDNFAAFENWALANGYSSNLTIDRINNLGNYEPNNCRWVGMREQHRNTTKNIVIEYQGKKQCLKDWCVELGKTYPTIANRIQNGWQPKYALLVPKNIRRRSEKYNEICAIIG